MYSMARSASGKLHMYSASYNLAFANLVLNHNRFWYLDLIILPHYDIIRFFYTLWECVPFILTNVSVTFHI